MQWYDEPSGLWSTTGWWNSANCLTTLADLAMLDPTVRSNYASVWGETHTNAQRYNPVLIKAKAPSDIESATPGVSTQITQPSFLSDYYDDEGWWALAWIRIFDVTGDRKYLAAAATIFNDMAASWPTTCNSGGIWWDRSRTYVDAIANELFIQLAAALANRVNADQKPAYLTWATNGWRWLQNSSLINPRHTINDGLSSSCKNTGGTVWSSTQGVMLAALVELCHATGDATYLDTATLIADATLESLTDADGVLHDVCEPDCGSGGGQSKGIFMRGLRELQLARPQMRWYGFLKNNAQSIWERACMANGQGRMEIGVDWAGPFVGAGNASVQSSGLDALVAALATM